LGGVLTTWEGRTLGTGHITQAPNRKQLNCALEAFGRKKEEEGHKLEKLYSRGVYEEASSFGAGREDPIL